MNELSRQSSIQKYSSIELFPEVPDYAVDVLWMAWEKLRRKRPPDNIVCTTLKAYQKFCQVVKSNGVDFPNVFVTRDSVQDVHLYFNGGWVPRDSGKKFEQVQKIQRIHNAYEQWPESDDCIYVAFVYEGYDRHGLAEVVAKRLKGAI